LPSALFAPPIAAMVAARDATTPRRSLGACAAVPPFLDVELEAVSLSVAGGLGLSDAWVGALARADAARATALRIAGVPLGSPARGVLRAGDFLLRVDGATVSAFQHVEKAAAAAAADARVTLTLWRGGAEVGAVAALARACPLGTRRMLLWAGMLLQPTYRAVLELGFAPGCATEEEAAAAAATAASSPAAGAPDEGVFLARIFSGSPAEHWGLNLSELVMGWITAVNGTPTPNVDALIAAAAPLRDGEDVRLALVGLDTKRRVRTLRLDLHYWPTYEVVADADGEWHRRDI
jgi:S1-C subfamily serine protease